MEWNIVTVHLIYKKIFIFYWFKKSR